MQLSPWRKICLQGVEPDGLVFEPDSVGESVSWRMLITEAFVSDFAERLGRPASPCSWISVSVIVVPEPEMADYPTILDLPVPA